MPDPLAEYYFRWSPYSTCYDNPIRFTDPNGLGIIDWINRKTEEAKKRRNSEAQMQGEIPEVTITAKRKNVKHTNYVEKRHDGPSRGVSLTGPNGQNGNNPDAEVWFEIDWPTISWFVLTLKQTPYTKPVSPSRQKRAERSGKAAAETSDEEIYKETTGNPEVSGPENQTIVETYRRVQLPSVYDDINGVKRKRLKFLERYGEDSVIVKTVREGEQDTSMYNDGKRIDK